jgi:alpha-beta hydrolase superfamily lysophospholipase
VGTVPLNVDWRPDVLGGRFEAATLALRPDTAGPLAATLVRHRRDAPPSRRAVLYVHGYNDYFFQTELAAWFSRRDTDFYAIDLRNYGRSLAADRIPNYTADLADYDEDLDAALDVILEAGHQRVVLVAHSTGGLITPLWASRRPLAPIDGLALNSPFLELKQSAAVRAVVSGAASAVARRQPLRTLPAGIDTHYGDSLHASRRGEWNYDLAWKPSPGFPIRFGWLHAVVAAQRTLHAGLDLRVPALVMSSTRTVTAREQEDDFARGDAVLDADSIARWAPSLGRNVTVVRIADGMHDLFLSPQPARERAYDTMATWLNAWVG